MKIQIKYRALVTDDKQKVVSEESIYRQIAGMVDNKAELSRFFEQPVSGLEFRDAGVSFQYDESSHVLLSVAGFYVETPPTDNQLNELTAETTRQMDRGYYGDDGWFIDIGESSYYVQLVDHAHLSVQPVSVDCE